MQAHSDPKLNPDAVRAESWKAQAQRCAERIHTYRDALMKYAKNEISGRKLAELLEYPELALELCARDNSIADDVSTAFRNRS